MASRSNAGRDVHQGDKAGRDKNTTSVAGDYMYARNGGKIVKNVYNIGGRNASNDNTEVKKQRAKEYLRKKDDDPEDPFCDNCGANLDGMTRANCSECLNGNADCGWCLCVKCYRNGNKCEQHPQSKFIMDQ